MKRFKVISQWWNDGGYLSLTPILIGFVAGAIAACYTQWDDNRYALSIGADYFSSTFERENVLPVFFFTWVVIGLLSWALFFRSKES